ncbi:hypothetical protein KBB96_09270 [Luteolibacter ambystomatis]|uniref:Uncharacterized protein n=1 Tax=Luteolibacter ambystomatis TaxID=2824561 RepID=A0A975J2X6_9BACT|nr:hypothetical protein [Luteolibacter ambystomatis]QUE53068.1 hypothetical protein KBB96_09270 [Luteolibacter ambystomatis]
MHRAILLLPLCAGLFSCAPQVKPLPLLPLPQAAPVVPAVDAIRPGLQRAADSAAGLHAANDLLARDLATATDRARTLATETARLAGKGTATAAQLTRVAAENAALRDQVDAFQATVAKQTSLIAGQTTALDEARNAHAAALAAASTGDSAVAMLTRQAQALTSQYQFAESARQSLAAEAAAISTAPPPSTPPSSSATTPTSKPSATSSKSSAQNNRPPPEVGTSRRDVRV